MADLDPAAVAEQIVKLATGLGTLTDAGARAASSLLNLQSAQRTANEAMKAATSAPDDAAKAMKVHEAAVKASTADAAQQIGSAMSAAQHPIDAAAGALGKMGPQGAAAAAALTVVTAAGTATVGTMTSLAEKAIEVGERMAALRAGFAGLAGSAAGGKAVQDMLGNLNLPFAGAQVNAWAATLVGAGVKGRQLEAEIRAIAAAQASGAVFGKAWGAGAEEFFKKMGEGGKEADELLKKIQKGGRGAEQIKAMGLNIEDLGGQAKVAAMNAQDLTAAVTKALQVKGAGALENMANTWDVIKMKAAAGFASIFSGLGGAKGPVEAFMSAVKSLFGEFSKGGVAVNILRPIVTTVFSTLFAWATKVINFLHRGFLTVAIAGLQLYIFLRPALTTFAALLASGNMLRGLAIVFAILATPFVVLGVVMLIVVGIIGTIIGVVVALAAAFVYVVGAVAGFVGSIASAFSDAYAAATGAGGSIVDGLVAGVTAGASAFVGALKGLASSGLAAFTGFFKIGSPSKVMHEHGQKNIAEDGLAGGIDEGADKVDASMGKLGAGGVSPPAAGARAHGGERHVHFHYVGPADQADSFFEKAGEWLQGLNDEAWSPG